MRASWCGSFLPQGRRSNFVVVATLLHPSRETAKTIVASQQRLVAAHVV